MSVASAIKKWVEDKCPYLDEFKELFMDYLDDDQSYSLEFTPADPIVKRYADGSTVRRKQFSFCSRVIYEGLQNIDTAEFFEKFQEWMENCNRSGDLPDLGDIKKTPYTVKTLTDGYLYDETGKMGQYRIQCEFKYIQTN